MSADAGNPTAINSVYPKASDGGDKEVTTFTTAVPIPVIAEKIPEVVDVAERDVGCVETAEPQSESQSLRLPLVLTLAGAAFLNTLSVQSVVIILPSIGRELQVPTERQEWIISAYYLTFGCFLLLWGRLADIYGRRTIFICGSAWLTVVTIAVPFAPNEIVFDVLRGFQGIGAAANVPTAIGILGATFVPGKAKNYAFAIYSAGSSCGSVLGNIFSGIIGEYLTWKWIFWLFAILAGLITIAGHMLIPSPREVVVVVTEKKSVHVDWIGAALVTGGVLLLNFAMTQGNVVGWGTFWVPILIVAAILIVAVFVLWQWYLEFKTTKAPLMRVSIFKNTRFNAAQIIMSMFFAAFNNYLIYATYFYQDYLGLSVIQTAIRFIPTGIMGLVGNFVAALLLSRVRGTYLLVFSTLCVSVSCLLMAVPIPPETTYWAYGFPAMVLSTLGADILHPTLTLFTAESLPAEDQAMGGALITAVVQIGRAVGLSVASVIRQAVERRVSGTLHVERVRSSIVLEGLRAGEYFNFSLAVAAFVVAVCFFRGRERVGNMKKK
ncbi:MFS general substrate transporter [Clathrospora elynae]|uniref:MFS general substrate transporter n=1 Tax=Clathrospora elynae TaxID=706981 RepID=A0A6A5SIS4_9PLEO|nr:MFS general substrate transporter [Clathrospora elynae]